jgi:two-component system response regulator MprA
MGVQDDDELATQRRPRVLIADDDDTLRELMAKMLVRRGHEVREACDGDEVLEWLSVSVSLGLAPPDVLVLDVDMPRRTGVDLLVNLRNAGSEIPVILITARLSPEVRSVASWGAALVLEKPFTMDVLEAAVLGVKV